MKQSSSRHAVIYVTDAGFTVPSLVSANLLRETTKSPDYDILFFLIDFNDDDFLELQNSFPDIQFFTLKSSELKLSQDTQFREGHVPIATLGRLVLSQYIPPQYEHILYIDGDTQILDDISDLISLDVPEGKIASVNGSMWLPDRSQDEYLKNLGGVSPQEYFNAGILAFRASTWKTMGIEALNFFLNNSEACQFHDQSALNAVFNEKRIALEPCYNFNTEFAKLKTGYKPKIVHFTGGLKPWSYTTFPWKRKYAQPYIDILTKFPFLQKYMDMPQMPSSLKQILRDLKMLYKLRGDLKYLFKGHFALKKYVRSFSRTK